MEKEPLIKVIDFWQRTAKEGMLFPRALTEKIDLKSREITDITGPRRSGKSCTMKLLLQKLKDGSSWLYINFEDPFFVENNQPQIIEQLIEVCREYFCPALKYLFFDEIQNIEKWEKAVRKLHEEAHYAIFITGSSSKLLSGELSSLITGRHLSYELMPLTFEEYLTFNNIKVGGKKDFILKKTKIAKKFDNYLKLGGFPKIVLEKNEELLKQYYSDILEKDIIKRYDIRHKSVLEKMGIYLLSNSAKVLSISSLARTFNISFEVAATYLDYFKEAFLVFDVPQFSYSLKTQQKALKKIYAVDAGLANAVSFRFSGDRGRILENAVFLQLKSAIGGRKELYYYKTKNNLEVDFLVKEKDPKKTQLIQVCADFRNEKTRQREIRSLIEAMDELKLSMGLILTEAVGDVVKIKNKTIHVFPASEWFLSALL